MSDFQGVPRLWPPCKLCLILITQQSALIFWHFSLSQNLSWAPSSCWFEFSSNPGQKDFCITDGNWDEPSAKVLTQNTDRLIWKYAKLNLHLCARVSFLFVNGILIFHGQPIVKKRERNYEKKTRIEMHWSCKRFCENIGQRGCKW